LIQKNNDAGIYGFQFYIRGKPWDVVVDDKLYVSGSVGSELPVFARSDATRTMLWGPILEKAWAKVTGSYANYYGSYGS